MNSSIYDRKKHSYKNRPYYCPINNMWVYPYMYMNPYMFYMINPFMTSYKDSYMNPSYYGNMCSYDNMNKCKDMRGYDGDNHGFTKEDIYTKKYKKEKEQINIDEEDLSDDIVIFNENKKEHMKEEEKSDKIQNQIYQSDLKPTFIEKKDIQLEEVNKEEKVEELKEKELYREMKINMRKVPLKEIID